MSKPNRSGDDQQELERKVREFYDDILDKGTDIDRRKYLMALINFKIEKVRSKNARATRIDYWLKISILLLAALSTIILGLKLSPDDWSMHSANLALIITSVITFLSGLSAFWDIENYRMRTKIMYNKLKELRYEFAFLHLDEQAPEEDYLRQTMKAFLNIIGDGYWERRYLQRLDESGTRKEEKE
ncbi:hypothetical protein [Lewinella sp. W8]|uniref:hypothetical protein n=1 Tax=Lewinella sp. W8 TaxID=2528208 RepID=UPI0010684B26|nr:hypothetical protein [Lewinella sp. W8]MTB52098.1 hypothetical protein [Lewinella sp. W8]